MKKSVEIVTFHNAYNYGAVLQCYALKKIIEGEGNICNVRNHQNERINRAYAPNIFVKNSSIKEIIYRLIHCRSKLRKHKAFYPFIEEYLLSDGQMPEGSEEDKIYICGSDQVWNYNITSFDKTYFLDFVQQKKQKNAFSASFGLDSIPEEYKQEYQRLLSDFNIITVREKEGADIIKDLLGIEVPVTLDPTYLLSKEEWELIIAPDEVKGKYILLYLMEETNDILSFAKKLSEITGEKIVYISNATSQKIKGVQYKSYVTPQEWLSLFKHASYVVTNSFHGIAFSVIFQRNVYIDLLSSSSTANSRLENIIRVLGLQNRMLSSFKTDHIENMNYNPICRILVNERVQSLRCLRRILNG
ncbi:polysaccharide pyruvyl transferase family protein [Eubacterium sp. ER2]|uniref:polysaccharide pyruvyl transferase family protein n=1 Tax=Eubacterium sp. ER2 TaxID=1519438 RepID=UPI00051AE998|nr:polysaccharide pyruvyl transferase family protein [Eubacterium sp. ER2]